MSSNDLNLLLSLFFSAILLICIVSTEYGVLFILYYPVSSFFILPITFLLTLAFFFILIG